MGSGGMPPWGGAAWGDPAGPGRGHSGVAPPGPPSPNPEAANGLAGPPRWKTAPADVPAAGRPLGPCPSRAGRTTSVRWRRSRQPVGAEPGGPPGGGTPERAARASARLTTPPAVAPVPPGCGRGSPDAGVAEAGQSTATACPAAGAIGMRGPDSRPTGRPTGPPVVRWPRPARATMDFGEVSGITIPTPPHPHGRPARAPGQPQDSAASDP